MLWSGAYFGDRNTPSMPPCPCHRTAGTLSIGVFSPCCVTSQTGPTFSVTSMRPSGRNAMRHPSLNSATLVIVNGRLGSGFKSPALIWACAGGGISVSSRAAFRSVFMNLLASRITHFTCVESFAVQRRPMTNKMWARRSLMSGMSAVAAAFAFGARPASAQTATAPFQPARHPQDEWLDKIPGKHRVVFDVVSSRGVPEALHFANNIYSGNKSMYGLEQGDLAVLIVLRHAATAFGSSDAMWAKYGKALAAATSYADPKSSE